MLPQPVLRVTRLEDRLVPSGSPLDLTTRGASGAINGAFFAQFNEAPAAGDAAEIFLRVKDGRGPTEHGYNTDHRPLFTDASRDPRVTHSLKVADVPSVTVGGVAYKEFLLDTREPGKRPLVSLDELRLYVGSTGKLHGYNPRTKTLGGKTPVYDLDAGGDHWVKLDDRLDAGRGRGDMTVLIPAAALAGGEYVYLYSKFGCHHSADGGAESWCVRPARVPPADPGTASISGTIFQDLILNGIQDEGEPGLANATVYLDANNNGVLDAGEVFTTTDADGSFTIRGLTGGAYTLRVVLDEATGLSSQPIPVFLNPGEVVTGITVGINMSPPS